MSKGWCGGHGVPESVCTRCNTSLIPQFKDGGDWCAEHGLPESQCELCNPGVAARWAALNPSRQAAKPGEQADTAPPELGPKTSPVPVDLSKGWCGGHGVPELVCTRCDASLIPRFKEGGDWCADHGLPESQCELCNPGVSARWAALRPQSRPNTESTAADLELERVPRLLTASSDPLCQVDTLRVRFRDASVAKKAGIRTEPVRPRRISATIDVPAEVEFDATRVTRVTPRAAGVVREVAARIGDTVTAGDLLAVIDSSVLGEAKSQYIERKQNYLLAQADHERVRTVFEGVQRMLRAVTDEAPLKEIRRRLEGVSVGEAKARLLRAHAALQFSRAEAAREAQLLDKKISSERDFQTAQSALAAAEAEFLASREEIGFNSHRDKLAAERALTVARVTLEAAERRLHILGLDEEHMAAVGSEPDTQLSLHELHSPVSGRVVERHVSAGEAVGAADVVFVVADNATMWLLADVYERDLLLLREGVPVLFTVDGLPGVSFEGRASWISSQVDDRTRTVRVRADLPNDDGLLRANMFGQARLVVRDDSNVLSVPSEAVQTDGCCQLVFVREDDAVFAPRKVTLGASANGYVEVLKGLAEGELVATTGSFLMKTEILKGNIGAGCCEVDPGR
jgi:cobalt-zinc-cadmium efflux system membrane fusion protein